MYAERPLGGVCARVLGFITSIPALGGTAASGRHEFLATSTMSSLENGT
jgi:hypothetical protein